MSGMCTAHPVSEQQVATITPPNPTLRMAHPLIVDKKRYYPHLSGVEVPSQPLMMTTVTDKSDNVSTDMNVEGFEMAIDKAAQHLNLPGLPALSSVPPNAGEGLASKLAHSSAPISEPVPRWDSASALLRLANPRAGDLAPPPAALADVDTSLHLRPIGSSDHAAASSNTETVPLSGAKASVSSEVPPKSAEEQKKKRGRPRIYANNLERWAAATARNKLRRHTDDDYRLKFNERNKLSKRRRVQKEREASTSASQMEQVKTPLELHQPVASSDPTAVMSTPVEPINFRFGPIERTNDASSEMTDTAGRHMAIGPVKRSVGRPRKYANAQEAQEMENANRRLRRKTVPGLREHVNSYQKDWRWQKQELTRMEKLLAQRDQVAPERPQTSDQVHST